MATRQFLDGDGVTWTVWMTLPSAGAVLRAEFAQGWLTFEAATGVRRRLAPAPPAWSDCSDAELEQLCRSAAVVPFRRTPPEIGMLFEPPALDPADDPPPDLA